MTFYHNSFWKYILFSDKISIFPSEMTFSQNIDQLGHKKYYVDISVLGEHALTNLWEVTFSNHMK